MTRGTPVHEHLAEAVGGLPQGDADELVWRVWEAGWRVNENSDRAPRLPLPGRWLGDLHLAALAGVDGERVMQRLLARGFEVVPAGVAPSDPRRSGTRTTEGAVVVYPEATEEQAEPVGDDDDEADDGEIEEDTDWLAFVNDQIAAVA